MPKILVWSFGLVLLAVSNAFAVIPVYTFDLQLSASMQTDANNNGKYDNGDVALFSATLTATGTGSDGGKIESVLADGLDFIPGTGISSQFTFDNSVQSQASIHYGWVEYGYLHSFQFMARVNMSGDVTEATARFFLEAENASQTFNSNEVLIQLAPAEEEEDPLPGADIEVVQGTAGTAHSTIIITNHGPGPVDNVLITPGLTITKELGLADWEKPAQAWVTEIAEGASAEFLLETKYTPVAGDNVCPNQPQTDCKVLVSRALFDYAVAVTALSENSGYAVSADVSFQDTFEYWDEEPEYQSLGLFAAILLTLAAGLAWWVTKKEETQV